MATIAAGLLLALALEHAAEVWHERGQRQQLASDLREEGLRNRGYLDRNVAMLDASIAWLEHAGSAVREARAGRGAAYPEGWDGEMRRMRQTFGIPTSAVWTTSAASGAVRLLPRPDAFAYARLYFMHDLVVAMDVERRKAVAAVRAAERTAGAGPDGVPVLASASAAQLDALAAALAHQQAIDAHVRSLLVGYRALNEAVLAGNRSGDLPVAADAPNTAPSGNDRT
jgi:hypothetical protein